MEKPDIGVALVRCFLCGEGKEILINSRLTKSLANKVRSMDGKSIDKEPCDKCKGYMNQGIIIIAVDSDKTDDPENPYRTGGWWVVRVEALERTKEIFDEGGIKMLNRIINNRVGFMDESICRMLGFYDS